MSCGVHSVFEPLAFSLSFALSHIRCTQRLGRALQRRAAAAAAAPHHAATSSPTPQAAASLSMPSSVQTVLSTSRHTAVAARSAVDTAVARALSALIVSGAVVGRG